MKNNISEKKILVIKKKKLEDLNKARNTGKIIIKRNKYLKKVL